MTATTLQETPPDRKTSAVVWLCAGVGAVVVGLLPWIVTGMRLPLQNLWATNTLPGDMPHTLLPFSQYHVGGLFGMIVASGTVAGLVARLVPGGRARSAGVLILLGTTAALAVAVVQTLLVIRHGLRGGLDSWVYVIALTTLIGVSLLMALWAGTGLGRARGPGAAVAASVAGIGLGRWIGAFLELAHHHPDAATQAARWVADYSPAVVAGVALARCGWHPARRIGAWVGAALLLWLVPAILEAITVVGGYRVYAHNLLALRGIGRDTLVRELEHGWERVALALVIGVVMGAGLERLRHLAAEPA